MSDTTILAHAGPFLLRAASSVPTDPRRTTSRPGNVSPHASPRQARPNRLDHFPITLSERLFTSPRRGGVKGDPAASSIQPYRKGLELLPEWQRPLPHFQQNAGRSHFG